MKKRLLALFLCTIVCSLAFATPTFASQNSNDNPAKATVTITNPITNKTETLSVETYRDESQSAQIRSLFTGEITEVGDVYCEISSSNPQNIRLLDKETYESIQRSRTVDTSTEDKLYWQATVSITYTLNSEYCTFSKASAKWIRGKGVSTLSDRRVDWACTFITFYDGATYYPTTLDVSYNTGLSAKPYGTNSIFGCTSSATITNQAGLPIPITASISKSLV